MLLKGLRKMSIRKTVFEIIKNLCNEEHIHEEADLQNDLMFDSLMMVTLLIELEEALNIELDEADMNPFELILVSDVVDLANKYCGECNE